MDALAEIEHLGATIKARIEKADKYLKDSEDHYISAGLILRDARIKVQRRTDITWAGFCAEHCHITQRRANDYIRMVEGKTTLAELRAVKNESSKASHAKTRAAAKSALNSSRVQKPQSNRSPGQILTIATEAFMSLPPTWQQRFLDKHGLLRAETLSKAA